MRFKSVLGAFLFILLAGFITLLIYVQTKSFGVLVTKVVSDLSYKKLNTEVKIKHFSLSLFPPGLELNQVQIHKKISDQEEFTVELGRIGLYINLFEMEEKKLTLGEVKVEDSVISYKFPKKDEETKEIDRKLIKKIFDTTDGLPIGIDTLLVENSRIILNHELVEARRFKVFKKDHVFVVRFHLVNLLPDPESGLKVDEVMGDLDVSVDDIKIHRLKAQHDTHSLVIKGQVKDYHKLKGSQVSLIGNANIFLKSLSESFPIPQSIKLTRGELNSEFSFKYKDNVPSAVIDLTLRDLRSNLLYADELKSQLLLNNKELKLSKLSLNFGEEQLELKAAAFVADFEKMTYLNSPLKVAVKNLNLNNVLRILGPGLKKLKGKLTGVITLEQKKKDFYISLQDNFIIKNLGLVVGEAKDPFEIIMIKKAVFNNTQMAVIENEFQLSTSADLGRSKLEIEGMVSDKKIQFTAPDSVINLEDFGNISGLGIKGAGKLSLKVSGPPKGVVINLKGKTKGFEVLGYKLDETDKDLSIDLGESSVTISKMESLIGRTHLSGNGTVNWADSEIALGISSNDTSFVDLAQILHPIFKDLSTLPEDLDFKAKIDVDIFGKYKFEELKIRAGVSFTDLVAYGETLAAGSFQISLMDKILSFLNFNTDKGSGNIQGNFSFDLDHKKFKLKYHWENLALSSFNFTKKLGLNLNSTLSGNISGGGPVDNFSLKLDTVAFDTKAQGHKFQDSVLKVNILPSRIVGEANIFGKSLISDFNFSLKKGMASQVGLKLEVDNLKPFLVALLGQHLETENFTGKLRFDGQMSFKDDLNDFNLTANLSEFVFTHPEFNVKHRSDSPQFLVKDSQIQKWDLKIRQPDLQLITSGSGVFGKTVQMNYETILNSKLLEILVAPILSSEGHIKNDLKLIGKGTDFHLALRSRSNDLDLSIENVPVPLNDLTYEIEYTSKRLAVKELSTSLDAGSISAKGDIFFEGENPDINLKFIFDKAEIPILGKSSVNLTGDGIVLGNNPPYVIGGEVIINKAQIVNELNEFSSKSAGFSQIRFLPKNQESPFGKMFLLNLNVKADNPIRITNSLMDVALIGELRLTGNPARPRAEGHLFSPVNSSRIFFKNNEYQITSADINFNPKKEISNPDFDVQALTYISTFKIFPKAYGDLERFNFDLTSDPPLPRDSILSLIAFGYTNELQSSLRSEDQQSLTQVGVGSFVFDRFKISDILNKQFGLQLNLGTVIEQSTTDSLLSGRSQDGGGGQGSTSLGRTRSATKIELKKRLNEALTLSVSSTMGGTIGQRQSMNLNYGYSKNVQVEGVYEVRTNEEGEADIIYDSIGGDIKIRRTFK